jgi:hypothetical protein
MIRFPAIGRYRRSLGAAVALVGIALLSASCIKIDIGIQLKADGSGTISFLTAVDSTYTDAFSSSIGGATGTPDTGSSFTSIDKSKLPPGATVTPYSQGKYKGEQVTAPFKSADDLPGIIEQISASSGSSTDTPGSSSSSVFDNFSLKGTGETWAFDATVPAPSSQDLGSFGVTPEQLKVLFKDASFTVRLKLPGSVSSSNADSTKGGELTWNLDIFATQPRTLSARSKPGGSGFPVVPVVAVAVVAVAAGAAFIVVRRRRGIVPV